MKYAHTTVFLFPPSSNLLSIHTALKGKTNEAKDQKKIVDTNFPGVNLAMSIPADETHL